MTVLEFEIQVNEDNQLTLPTELLTQLKPGMRVQLRVALSEAPTSEKHDLWQSILDGIEAHIAQGPTPDAQPYTWNREELYN